MYVSNQWVIRLEALALAGLVSGNALHGLHARTPTQACTRKGGRQDVASPVWQNSCVTSAPPKRPLSPRVARGANTGGRHYTLPRGTAGPPACRPPCAWVYWGVLCCVDDAGLRLMENPHTHAHTWWWSRGSSYRAGGHDAPRVGRRCCKAFTEERPRHPAAASCVRGVSRGSLHSQATHIGPPVSTRYMPRRPPCVQMACTFLECIPKSLSAVEHGSQGAVKGPAGVAEQTTGQAHPTAA